MSRKSTVRMTLTEKKPRFCYEIEVDRMRLPVSTCAAFSVIVKMLLVSKPDLWHWNFILGFISCLWFMIINACRSTLEKASLADDTTMINHLHNPPFIKSKTNRACLLLFSSVILVLISFCIWKAKQNLRRPLWVEREIYCGWETLQCCMFVKLKWTQKKGSNLKELVMISGASIYNVTVMKKN